MVLHNIGFCYVARYLLYNKKICYTAHPNLPNDVGWFSSRTGRRSGKYVIYMFTLWELRQYRHSQDYRLLTRDILGYPNSLVISLVNPWYQELSLCQVDSGGLKRSHETRSCPGREAARRGDEWNVWHECLWRVTRDISTARITQSIIIILTYPLPGYASLAILSQLIPGYASLRLDILSSLILGYPNLQNLYRDILGYHPDLPRVSFF